VRPDRRSCFSQATGTAGARTTLEVAAEATLGVTTAGAFCAEAQTLPVSNHAADTRVQAFVCVRIFQRFSID
jgi:hypothetical protein